jgi:hypothetical protein
MMDMELQEVNANSSRKIYARLAGATAVGVLSIGGLVALAENTPDSQEVEVDALWHPVSKGKKVECVDPQTGSFKVTGLVISSEASYDAAMTINNVQTNPTSLSKGSTDADNQNKVATYYGVFPGSTNSGSVSANVFFPTTGESGKVSVKGEKPAGCEPKETTTTSTTTTLAPTTTTEAPTTTIETPTTTTEAPTTTIETPTTSTPNVATTTSAPTPTTPTPTVPSTVVTTNPAPTIPGTR